MERTKRVCFLLPVKRELRERDLEIVRELATGKTSVDVAGNYNLSSLHIVKIMKNVMTLLVSEAAKHGVSHPYRQISYPHLYSLRYKHYVFCPKFFRIDDVQKEVKFVNTMLEHVSAIYA